MSFKVPCGGFRLDEKLFSLDNNDVLSIPKPLTYDYMPEGYPSKGIEYVTLMEEQEVTFSERNGLMVANSHVALDIKLGDKLTVIWDGVSYDVVVKEVVVPGPGNRVEKVFGNLALINKEDTEDYPFACATIGSGAQWATTDTAASHTIYITTQGTVYKTIDKKFLPEAGKFVVDATNLPSDTDFTGWGNLSDSLRAAIDAGDEIFLDVYGNGKTLLKLTNAKNGEYLFIYPKSFNTVSAYVLEASKTDGGELKDYDIYTHTGTT